MSLKAIFKIDEYGYPHFAFPRFMPEHEAERIAATEFASEPIKVLTYGEYKALQDPDTMTERELRVRLGKDPVQVELRGVVVTGIIPGMTREGAETRLRSMGYAPQSDVNGKTAFVVSGEKPGSKVARARKAGIPVKTWSEVFN